MQKRKGPGGYWLTFRSCVGHLFLPPFFGLAYRLQPAGIKRLALRRKHGWLEAPGSLAMRGDLRCVPPETHGQSRQVGGTARSGLIDGRAYYGDAEDVGLEPVSYTHLT